MNNPAKPRVSIGMPVYNGEKYIRYAIDSVLAQTFQDYELVICDNASTDGTEAICRAYAEKDSRVRYHRNPQNLGAGPNYNLAFELAQSPDYFKWLAHDDVIEPTFLEKCIEALDAAPYAVLCQTLISNIDQDGKQYSVYDSALTECRTSHHPSARFSECILKRHRNSDIFGVIRRSAMNGSVLHGDYYCQDKAFVTDMSLQGRFLYIDEPLLGYRDHPDQFTHALKVFETLSWHNTSGTRWNQAAYLLLFLDYVKMVRRNISAGKERWRCYRHLISWWFTDKNFYIASMGILMAISPSTFHFLRAFRLRFIRRGQTPSYHMK